MEVSDSFNINFQCLKVFGIWLNKSPSMVYKCYAYVYLSIFLILYDVLLTINLFYTPLQVQLVIEEVLYYFNLVSVLMKVATIIVWRKEILEIFNLLDCELFKGNDEVGRDIITKDVHIYKIFWTLNAVLSNLCLFIGSVLAALLYLMSIFEESPNLPVSKYYFLDSEVRQRYYAYIYVYQLLGIYGQMMYNVNIDSFFAGLMFYAITQMKVLDHELRSLQWKKQSDEDVSESERMCQLKYCLRHYEFILKYCASVQDMFSLALFVQFGMASAIICVILCAFLLPEARVIYLLTYLAAMTLQISLPAWLGTQLMSESQQLVFAAYSSDWVTRCEPYKNGMKLFMQRANTPVVMAGMKLFTLNLDTFVAIMKTAYSFLTLLRSIQEDG